MAETRGAILIFQVISLQIINSYQRHITARFLDHYHIKPYHPITIFNGTKMVQNAETSKNLISYTN